MDASQCRRRAALEYEPNRTAAFLDNDESTAHRGRREGRARSHRAESLTGVSVIQALGVLVSRGLWKPPATEKHLPGIDGPGDDHGTAPAPVRPHRARH